MNNSDTYYKINHYLFFLTISSLHTSVFVNTNYAKWSVHHIVILQSGQMFVNVLNISLFIWCWFDFVGSQWNKFYKTLLIHVKFGTTIVLIKFVILIIKFEYKTWIQISEAGCKYTTLYIQQFHKFRVINHDLKV